MLRAMIVAVVGTVALAGTASTQSPSPSGEAGLAAMEKIAFMAGEWKGEGWMRRGPGEPNRFTSNEMVETRLDGRVLLVEGLHRAEGSGEVVHNAVALLSYDADTGGYRLQSHLLDGRSGDYPATLEDGSFVWTMEAPSGHIRYTITVEGDAWHEVGEFSADGDTWRPFFQMDLERVSG